MRTGNHEFVKVCACAALLLSLVFCAWGDIVVDNGDAGTSFTGVWEVSGGSDPYGQDSLWARDGATYTWQFDVEPAGLHEVFLWWSMWPSRATAVEVHVDHAEGSDVLLVNQQAAGGRWIRLGEYEFDGPGSVTIVAAAGASVSTCADAVWLKHSDPASATIIDNLDDETARTGVWEVSGGSGPYGPDSVWSRDGGIFTWHFSPPQTGDYEVAMWWTAWPSRSSSVPVDIVHAGGTERITVNQQADAGQWNSLGVYPFTEGVDGSITVLAEGGSPASYCADAVKFTLVQSNEAPAAVIDSIQPNPAIPGAAIAFEGHGTDADGEVTAYRWTSSLDGHLSDAAAFSTESLSAGVHEITFAVRDDANAWSPVDVMILNVSAAPVEVVIDNLDADVSSTGTWDVSAGSDCYGENSFWSRNGATFTWRFTPVESGEYEVSMWWTEYSSRSDAVSVDIEHAAGKARVTVNQQINGGRWNSLGVYAFDGGVPGSVTLWAKDTFPVSYCADAVKFTPIADSEVPVAVIDSVQPNPATVGQVVAFEGHGVDVDGEIVDYAWESSIDGFLSDAEDFSTAALSEGIHEITFEVCDDSGRWSRSATKTVAVIAEPAPVIIDNTDAATSQTGVWEISGGSDPYGADSVWSRDGGTFTWRFTPPQSGEYEVSMWWSGWFSRSGAAPVDIVHADGTEPLVVNQRIGSGRWNSLGVYTFTKGVDGLVVLTAEGPEPTSYCADAVKFDLVKTNARPVAVVDLITPNPAVLGASISFEGHGTDADGTIAAYRWASSIDGDLSEADSFSADALSEGVHDITFQVQDDAGEWSDAAVKSLTVGAAPIEIIVDNLSADTSFTGTWQASAGLSCYGADSFWSRNGATFTWYFTPAESGDYEAFLWWTEYPSRSTSVPVDIVHANGTKRTSVNQWVNGGRWNSLGVYSFNGGVSHAVTLTAPDAFPASYCADAVKFTKMSQPAGAD